MLSKSDDPNDGIYNYQYGFYFPRGARYAGSILVGGIGLLNIQYIWLDVCMIAVIFYVWSMGGTEVNFDENKYRDYQDFFLFKTGEWKDMKPDYISVFKAKMVKEVGSLGQSAKYDFEKIQVNLITKNRKRINLYECESVNRAGLLAIAIAKKYDLKVLDATGREQKWVEL